MRVFSIWLVWCASMIWGAQADDAWDDFSNNLATDLSPLIALFGEQATKQFLSESLSPLDNFIFAMAPLGILTAVVSAIRVCGSSSLRAFIGRAQEGGGTVEAELCSSTSRSVSELYNNGGIARVFGRPKILEVVQDPASNDFYDDHGKRSRFRAGIFTFREYRSTEKGVEEWTETSSGIGTLLGEKSTRAEPVTEAKKLDADNELAARNPNLSLNIGIKRQPDWVFWAAALIGFLIQAAVLIFGAVVTYRLRWDKDGRSPDPWAFPLMLTGTLLQCSGMFLCARLVEQSTKERRFKKKSDSPDTQSRLHWLQPGNQAVGDQVFDAFAYSDTNKALDDYVSSYKDEGYEPVFLVWVAISATMGGFIQQFIGLRAMHSSVAVFQLGAMLVMSIIRAGLRARRFDKDENKLRHIIEEVQGHELDWQALHFEAKRSNRDQCWFVFSGPIEEQSDSKTEDGSVFIGKPHDDKARTIAGFRSKCDTEEVKLISEAQKDEHDSTRKQYPGQQQEWRPPRPCLAVRLFKYRARLAQLTMAGNQISTLATWDDQHVEVRNCARKLQILIEGTAEIMFSDTRNIKEEWRDVSSFHWALSVATVFYSPHSKRDPVFLAVRRETESSAWKVELPELEAVLGLWTWSWKNRPWRGHWEGRYPGGPSGHNYKRVISKATQNDEADLVLWMDGLKRKPQRENMVGRKGAPLFGLNSVKAGTQDVLTVPVNCCLVDACAQDIFMSFLSAAASITDSFGGTTKPGMGSNDFILVNDKLSKLVQIFLETGLGSREDAYLCIVPVLQARSRLPSASQCLDTARLAASDARKRGDWKHAHALLDWAWRMSKTLAEQQKSTIALGEFYRWGILDKSGNNRGQFDLSQGIAWVTKEKGKRSAAVEETLLRYEAVFYAIQTQSQLQGSSILDAMRQNQHVETLALLRQGVNSNQVDEEGRTPLHWAAIRGWIEVLIGLLEIGAAPDLEDKLQRTALSYAAESGNLRAVRVLIEAGAFPNKDDKARQTPLSYAAAGGHDSVVELLAKDTRVACNTTDDEGQSPLHWAAKNNCLASVKILLSTSKAKQQFIDAPNNDGLTALILALMGRATEVAVELVDRGASCAVRVKEKPAWQWLIEQGHPKPARFLIARLNDALAAENSPLRNRADIYIYPESAAESIVASLGPARLPSTDEVAITVLDETLESTPATIDTMVRAAQNMYRALAIYSAVEGQQVKVSHKPISEDGLMGLVLASQSEDTKVTEKVVKAAAGNGRHGYTFLTSLLDHRPDEVKVTDDVITAAAANNAFKGPDILALLLAHRREEMRLTPVMVNAVASGYRTQKIIDLLLDSQGETTVIAEDTVIAMAAHRQFAGMFVRPLLASYPEKITITEEVVKAVAANKSQGYVVLTMLMSCRFGALRVTEDVVMAAAANGGYDHGIMKLLIVFWPGVVEKVAARDERLREYVSALLAEPQEVKRIEELVEISR
ncbi:ankyrin repeat domain-containing protein [Aspergillus mulundensis]|uniref:Uncharacterized protein n=1 Tax=Aspergillus mulundensis TaxID=1810919 RepID=A0A3D8RQU4_9EURO|nr:hypothetical protein DSM5745_06449 [Aspergillus mulundensis]RDW76457.1 hypothetical protein DSM5745_06449 [Aspergillus mulundensis]